MAEFQTLFEYSKIVTFHNGDLRLNLENLNKILSANHTISEFPQALFCITGPKGSGKSFFTNLAIQYLRFEGTGGWLTSLTSSKNKVPLEGFQFGDVKPGCRIDQDDSPGIQLYPEPFLVGRPKDKSLVWVLHITTGGEDSGGLMVEKLEDFIHLTCSRIVEIEWNNKDKVIQSRANWQNNYPSMTLDPLCRSIALLRRSDTKKSNAATEDKNEAIQIVCKSSSSLRAEHFSGLCTLGINSFWSGGPLHDDNGLLQVKPNLHNKLQNIIEWLVGGDSIGPKSPQLITSDQCGASMHLRLEDLPKFLEEAVRIVNGRRVTEIKACQDSSDACQKPSGSEINTDLEVIEKELSQLSLSSESSAPEKSSTEAESTPKSGSFGKIWQQSDYLIIDINEENGQTISEVPAGESSPPAVADFDSNLSTTDQEQENIIPPPEDSKKCLPCLPESQSPGELKTDSKDENGQQTSKNQEVSDEDSEKILKDLVAKCNKKLLSKIQKRVGAWVLDLDTTKIKDGSEIYEHSVQEILNEAKGSKTLPNEETYSKLETLLNKETKPTFDQLISMQNALIQHNENIQKRFQTQSFMTEENLEEILKKEIDSTLESLTDNCFFQSVEKACSELSSIYRQQNLAVHRAELQILEKCLEKGSQLCNNTIRNVVEKNLLSPASFTRIEDEVEKTITTSLSEMLEKQGYSMKSEAINLKDESEMKILKLRSREQLKRQHDMMKTIIGSIKTEYDTTLNAKFQQHATGITPNKLENLHVKTLESCIAKLKRKIEKQCGNSEPLDKHLITLRSKIDNSFKSFHDENSRRLKSSEVKLPENNRHNFEDTSPAIMQQPTTVSKTREDEKVATACSSNPIRDSQQSKINKSLPPLIFHLSFHKVTMNLLVPDQNGKWTLLPKEEVFEETIVGLTKQNEWVYGAAVRDRMSHPQDDSQFYRIWYISTLFAKGYTPFSEVVTIIDTEQTITVEFLLAIIFHGMRRKHKEDRGGFVKTTMITIPFWTATAHRQQIKDAATIAGFNDVFLLNENSAIAYGYLKLNQIAHDVNIYVFTENSGRLAVTIYSYNSRDKYLRMLSHCNADGVNDEETESMSKWLWNAGMSVIGLGGTQSCGNDDVGFLLEAALKCAEKKARKIRGWKYLATNKTIYAVSCEFEEHETMLIPASKKVWGAVSFQKTLPRNTAAAYGAYQLCLRLGSGGIGRYIIDCISFNLCKKSIQEEERKVQWVGGPVLPANYHDFMTLLPNNQKQVNIYQKTWQSEIVGVGCFSCDIIPVGSQVELHFQVNNEGIVSHVRAGIWKNGKWSELGRDNYLWQSHHLSDNQIAIFSSIMEYLGQKQVDPEAEKLAEFRSALEFKCKTLLKEVQGSRKLFKSDLAQIMVAEQIQENLDKLSHVRFDLKMGEDIERTLTRIEARYLTKPPQ